MKFLALLYRQQKYSSHQENKSDSRNTTKIEKPHPQPQSFIFVCINEY